MASDTPPRGFSLRWRLPLLIDALIAVVIVIFVGVAHREVRANLLQTTAERALAISGQLSGLLAQSARQRLAEIRRAAAHPAVRHALEHPSDETRDAALASLSSLTSVGPQLVELWDATGHRVVSAAMPAGAADVPPSGTAPVTVGVAPLQRYGSVIFSETVVAVPSETGAQRPSEDPNRIGFLVVRRSATASPTPDVLNRLVGQGATITIGNTHGGVWTDLSKAVGSPPIDLSRSGLTEYQAPDGRRHVGALSDISGTPWAVWVEFRDDVIFAPARALLRRMVLVAFGVLALSSVVIVWMTARITTPLRELTTASEAIAAGAYAHRVSSRRRDELGRLATAFNTMAGRVEGAQRELEERVAQRTASLEQAGALLEQHVRDLKTTREDLDRFFALSPDLLCIADEDGRFTRINPSWESVLGWTSDELRAAPYLDFVHPDDRERTAAEASKLTSGTSTLNFENRYREKQGSFRWLSWTAVFHPERRLIYASARDITEQKLVARALLQRADELADVNRELEAFSYSVSHDLRAPLRHITGFATLLEQSAASSFDGDARRYMKTIQDAALRMGRLIDDLLAFSRMGRTQLVRSPVDLNQLARDAQREVDADVNGRAVSWQVHELPVVNADPSLLRLVMVNLLSNAVKYTGTRPQAEIEVGALGGNGNETVVYVRDNGVGFDMQYADKLFGVFQRLHRQDEFEGTGIGLANVRRIVHRHGGRTWAEGRVDAGATFYFSLPS